MQVKSHTKIYPRGERVFFVEWSPAKHIGAIVMMAFLYFFASRLGFTMAFAAEQVSVVWPPAGIALAGVVLLGNRIWPGIALGAFLANITAHEPAMVAGFIALGNTLEALAGAWLLQRLKGSDASLGQLNGVLGLMMAALGATMISATIGVSSLCMGGVQPWDAFRALWLFWWLGDMTGALIVAPVLMVWGNNPFLFWEKRDVIEAATIITAAVLACLGIFAMPLFTLINSEVFIYLAFPLIILAALRFGQRGTTFVTFAISFASIAATLRGVGPFSAAPVSQSLTLLQIFMAVVAVCGLLLGAAINERQKAEGSRAMLAAIIESSRDAIIARDLSGIITFWNGGAERLFGYKAEEAIGRNISLIIPREKRKEETQFMQCLRQGDLLDKPYETTGLTRDGRLLDISLSISPIRDGNGRIVGASKVVRDLEMRKQVEVALRDADRRKNEFIATLAHELRNPLGTISNALRVLQLKNTAAPQCAEACDVMEGQLRYVLRLVDDLLDVSSISHGKVKLLKERITLNDAIRLAQDTVKPVIEAGRHTLSVHLPQEKIWLDGDLTRLSQIFANLLNNAAKYTPPGGRISLQAVSLAEMAEVRIFDNGIGIQPEMLPHIFSMFMQADAPMERSYGGLGIGLTIVKSFVEMHGGMVEARSDGKGRGSEFIVRLPLAEAPAIAAPPKKLPVELTRLPNADEMPPRLRVLIVDDSKALAKTLGWMVDILGHETLLAHSGEEALACFRRAKPDIVLLDISLPDMNGYEVCKKMRMESGAERTIIISQTGWTQQEHHDQSREAGFQYHLVKPVSMQTLEQLLQSLPKIRQNLKKPEML